MSKLGRSPVVMSCAWCGQTFLKPKSPSNRVRFCGRSCSAKWRMRQPGLMEKTKTPEAIAKRVATLRATGQVSKNLGQVGRRRSPEAIAKGVATKKRNGTHNRPPKSRGGNGKVARREAALQKLLGDGWQLSVVVQTTDMARPRPTHYKLDVANSTVKVNVELDGPSHSSEKARVRDARKDAYLNSQGWWVFRFKNTMFDHFPEQVAETIVKCIASRSTTPTTSSPTVFWSQTANRRS